MPTIKDEVARIAKAGYSIGSPIALDAWLNINGSSSKIILIVSVVFHKDYANNLYDFVTLMFRMQLGDAVHVLGPNKDNLEVTLNIRTIGESLTVKYKAVIGKVDPSVTSGKFAQTDQKELNKNMTDVSLQLIPKVPLAIKNMSCGGVYTKSTLAGVLSDAINTYANNTEGIDIGSVVKSYIVSVNNNRVYDHIVIPDDTLLVKLPTLLQEKMGGLYNGGIGTYIVSGKGASTFNVYPLYRPNGSFFIKNKLEILALSVFELVALNTTYAMSSSTTLKIIVPAITLEPHDGETNLINTSVGFNATENSAIRARSTYKVGNVVVNNSKNTKRKMAHKRLADGSVPMAPMENTSNFYEMRTKALKSDGRFVEVEWNNSNARLLTPAMPVTYVTEERGKKIKYEGVLHGVIQTLDNTTKTERSKLRIFLRLDQGIAGPINKLGELL